MLPKLKCARKRSENKPSLLAYESSRRLHLSLSSFLKLTRFRGNLNFYFDVLGGEHRRGKNRRATFMTSRYRRDATIFFV